MSQQQVETIIENMNVIVHIFMRDVYYDLHPTAEQQEDENWWKNVFLQKAVNSHEYNFQKTWEELRDTPEDFQSEFLIIEMINQINEWSKTETVTIWDFGVLTHSKIYKMYAYMHVMQNGVEHWKLQSVFWNHDMDDMSDAESVEEEYTGTKDFPPNETDDNCPVCLDAYTEENKRDGIRCSDIPSNCSHYCCERCWYVIWGQHNDTNNCPICKRDITEWLSTHYPNQAIKDFLKTLPPK